MNRMLVASDLSRRSDRAVRQALHLSRRFGAALTVLHVVDDELPEPVFESEREQAMASLRGSVERWGGGDTADVEVRVVGGLDFQVIVEAADAGDAALIVLGAHRRNILKDVFTGTTVERVIRTTTRPVLVVKRPEPGDYVCTLAAVDLVAEAAGVVRLARSLSGGNTLYLAHALTDVVVGQMTVADAPHAAIEEYRRKMAARCRGFLTDIAADAGLGGGDWLPVVDWGSAAERTLATAQTFGADLCVVGTRTHARGAAARFLLGSVAEELLRDLPCDVLAVPLPGHTERPGAADLTTPG